MNASSGLGLWVTETSGHLLKLCYLWKQFQCSNMSHGGEKPRAAIDPVISSPCGQGVTSAMQSFISTNLHEMVLWQREAEKPRSLQGSQSRVQLPGTVNGFKPS